MHFLFYPIPYQLLVEEIIAVTIQAPIFSAGGYFERNGCNGGGKKMVCLIRGYE